MSESILEEAQRLTHGPRQADYGHPFDDYMRTAALVNAMLSHKFFEPLTAHEMALIMCCVKLSREMNHPKRDNLTDLAGYAWVAQECQEETVRRAAAKDEIPLSDRVEYTYPDTNLIDLMGKVHAEMNRG